MDNLRVKKLEQANAAIERAKVQKEINSNLIPPKYNFFEKMFKKTLAERIQLANAKMTNRRELIRNNFNPKKRMNTSEPFHAIIW